MNLRNLHPTSAAVGKFEFKTTQFGSLFTYQTKKLLAQEDDDMIIMMSFNFNFSTKNLTVPPKLDKSESKK